MIEAVEANNKTEKAIVILGAGIMQIPAIESAKRKGYITIVFDGNCKAQGAAVSDHFENIDLKNREALFEKCLGYRKKYQIAGVFTAGTDFSYIVAWLSAQLGLKSISYETSIKATDKSLMRQAFLSCNVPSPAWLITENRNIDETMVRKLGFPLVVKPVDSMGARGTVRVDDSLQLGEAFDSAYIHSRTGKVIIEQYIEGPEYSLDAVVKDGNITVCGIADRHIFFPPYFVEMGHTMPAVLTKEASDNIAKVFCDGIKAIGIDNGSAKGDIKYSRKGAVVGEIAARLSGGYMSGWTFPYSTGFSVIDAAIDIAVGNDPGAVDYSYINTAAERAFISIPGIVDSVFIPENIQKNIIERNEDTVIKELFLNVKPGAAVNFPKNNVEKCGNVIAVHREREKAVYAAEQACRDIFVKLKPCGEMTYNFIFNEKESWIPDAFNPGRTALEMPDYYGNIQDVDIFRHPINVIMPEAAAGDPGRDWQGRTLDNVLKQIEYHTNIRFVEKTDIGSSFAVGRLFWKSVARGSVQGGVWIVETLLEYLENGKDLKDYKW
ncbi:MAG: ATP-grasp domain-containing protein [Spirochaetales bacterium]|nr:ATP-grasp domain-containing protein [Spirochaetales bacterium]